MGWDAAIFGKLLVKDVIAWEKAKCGSAEVPDAAKHLSTEVRAPRAVSKVLAELASWNKASDWGFADVTIENSTISISAFLPDDDYLDWNVPIASLWAAAAPLKGTGELLFAGILTASFAYRLTVEDGTVKLGKTGVRKVDQRPEVKAILAKVKLRMEAAGIDTDDLD